MRKWVDEYRNAYKQDVSEDYIKSLIGQVISLEGHFGDKKYGFEALVVGYEHAVVVNPENGNTGHKWGILTDEGISSAVPKDAVIFVLSQKHTIKEWSKYLGVIIMDPDGFDRKDPNLWSNVYTQQEFIEGYNRSTCMFDKDGRAWRGMMDKVK
ncbi:MAG: hypothetical protein Q8910_04315 [Bacteroidota bacterium]|nr:hypothetical protein [Bacteroidota bacterium]